MLIENLWTNNELGLSAEVEKCGLGLSYGGGKRKLSKPIMEAILNHCGIAKPVVYDLFGGGGALTFQSAFLGLKTIYNDLNPNIHRLLSNIKELAKPEYTQMFLDNFITKDVFDAHKHRYDLPPMDIAFLNLYSFGGLMGNYTYNKNDITIKKHGHYFIANVNQNSVDAMHCFYRGRIGQRELKQYGFHNLILEFGEYLRGIEPYTERERIFTEFFNKIECITCTDTHKHFYDKFKGDSFFQKFMDFRQVDFAKELNALGFENKRLFDLRGFEKGYITKTFSAWQLILDIANFKNLGLIEWQNKGYDEVEIKHSPDECVILFDPPYKSIGRRLYKKNIDDGEFFDYDKFLRYVRELKSRGYKIYICEYEAPEGFTMLMDKAYESKFRPGAGIKRQERLYTL
jgi:site-specific DNA-adenine methylase